MSTNKPSVIPTAEQIAAAQEELNNRPNMDLINAANETGMEIANQFKKEQEIIFNDEVSLAEQAAAEAMRLKTEQQIAERERLLKIQQERADLLEIERAKTMNQKPPQRPPIQPPTNPTYHDMPMDNPEPLNKYFAISQPQMNTSFDVIPLPSEGKLYKSKKKSIKVAYLTASDENILTNPNIMESGEFLEILFNRKILEPELRYKDLHVGDRDAIMIWLRSTSYGHDYPITVYDPATAEPFEHIVDLSELKTKPLLAEPDKDGYIDFILPITKTPIKFKLFTVGDIDEIQEHIDEISKSGVENIDTITYSLSKQIVEINGNRDVSYINDYVQTMRAGDSSALRKYIEKIESGMDMKLHIGTPGGGSLTTFLPLNLKFFWPEL